MDLKVFIHIPKCGGSTVRRCILDHFSKERVIKIYNDNAKRDYYTVESLIEHFPDSIPPDSKAVIGHIRFPALRGLISKFDVNMMSLVRDPIDRSISELNYGKISEHLPNHVESLTIDKNNIFNFLKSKGARNYQTKYLGIDYFGGIEKILENINVYKIENYKQALTDLGVLTNTNENVELHNITKDRLKEKGLSVKLVSRADLTESQIEYLKGLYKEEFLLYESAR